MCLVRGRIFGVRANSKAPELSSNAWQWTSGEVESVRQPFALISLSSCIMGIALRSDCNSAMHSASVVDNVICVCSLLQQMTRQPAYRMA